MYIAEGLYESPKSAVYLGDEIDVWFCTRLYAVTDSI